MLVKNYRIIDMHSQWVSSSLIRTVTRQLTAANKVLVEVQEISDKGTSKQRALRAARDAARRVGCLSVDCCIVADMEMVKHSYDLHSEKPVRTKVRTSTFVFSGIAE